MEMGRGGVRVDLVKIGFIRLEIFNIILRCL